MGSKVLRTKTYRFASSVVVAACLCVMHFEAEQAQAQAKLKKLVFEDCDLAQKKAQELGGEERADFVAYLVRVLKMQLGVSSEVAIDGGVLPPVGGARDGIVSGNMWSLFEPSREVEAKQCAIRLLASGTPSLSLVPELIAVLQENSLPVELRDSLETLIWNIAKAVKVRPPVDTDAKSYSALISQLQSDAIGYVAGNILIELRDRSLPHLLAALSSPDLRRQQVVQNLLLHIDREGKLLGPALMPLLDSGDPLLRAKAIRLLSSLKNFFPQSVTAVVLRLGDPSPEVSREAVFALKQFFPEGSEQNSLSIDEKTSPLLFQMIERAVPEVRAMLEPAISSLLARHPEVQKDVLALVKSADPDLRERGFRVLSRSGIHTEDSFRAMVEGLFDSVAEVRLAAVHALSEDTNHAEEKAIAFLKAVKRGVAEKDSRSNQNFVLAIAEAMTKLPVTPSAIRMSPYFVDGLRFEVASESGISPVNDVTPVVSALIRLGPEVEGPVSKSLKDSDARVRRRAIEVLSKLPSRTRQTDKLLVFMLRDADDSVRAKAESALLHTATKNVEEIRKGLESKEFESRLAAARVLASLGETGPKLLETMRDAFTRAECGRKLSFVPPLIRLDQSFREKLQPFLVDCLALPLNESDMRSVIEVIQRLAPLQEFAVRRLIEILKDSAVSRNTRLLVLEQASGLGISAEVQTEVLLALLKDSDNLAKDRVAILLSKLGKQAALAVPELKDLAGEESTDGALRIRAAYALSEIDSQAFDWKRFFISELESEHSQWAVSILNEMKPETAIPFLEEALKKVSPEKRALVVSLVAHFGPKASRLVSSVIPLLRDSDSFTRFKATVALLNVEPTNPEAISALRKQLIGKFADDLFVEKLPPASIGLLEQIVAAPNSLVEEQTARLLVTKLKKG